MWLPFHSHDGDSEGRAAERDVVKREHEAAHHLPQIPVTVQILLDLITDKYTL